MKTEFFAAFDGVRAGSKDNKTDKSSSVLVIGATNRPEELDSAAIRKGRFIILANNIYLLCKISMHVGP